MAGQLKEIRDLPSANDITTGGGDFLHIKQGDVDRKIRVQDLFKFHTTNYNNPHGVTKTQVGLDQVTNDAQLKRDSNLADLPDKPLSRNNLGVYSKAEVDSGISSHSNRSDNPHSVNKTQVGLGNVVNSLQVQTYLNLADVPDKGVARNNLDVYSRGDTQYLINLHANRFDNPHGVSKAQIGLSEVANLSYSGDYNNSSHSLYATIGAVNSVYNILTSQYVRAARGMIIMWHGDPSAIPAGWALCNGANGTPNLLDRFIVGAGSSYGWGWTGGAATVSHGHGGAVQGTALTESQIPPHRHYYTDDDNWSTAAGNFGVSKVADLRGGGSDGGGSQWAALTSTVGGGKPHYHGLNIDGATLENRPPYYALFYIMKL